MRRHLLGLIALASLGAAVVASLYPPLALYKPAAQTVLRIGIVLGAFWLAWPDLHRLPGWAWFALPIALVLIIFARGLLIYALPPLALALVAFLVYRRLRRVHKGT